MLRRMRGHYPQIWAGARRDVPSRPHARAGTAATSAATLARLRDGLLTARVPEDALDEGLAALARPSITVLGRTFYGLAERTARAAAAGRVEGAAASPA